MDGFTGDMLGDSSVMARMQKKFWNTKQVLIKATGKKEDEYVVASDADLDAKLEFFRSVQSTCTELLKVIEKYQHRITRLSQEENEFGLFLRFQAERDRTKAGNMMDATSKALCSSAKQRMALCPPLQRMYQEVETFRRRAIADTLLTVSRMEKSRTEYRGALLWMKDISQELDPDTYKQLEKFRKVQAQVRGTKGQFEKLKNDVCQKVDMLGASRCNMLSHSLCTYQTTLLQYWEKTAQAMSGIHETFLGHIPYQFTTLKDLRDPLELISDSQKHNEKEKSNTDSLVSLDDGEPAGGSSGAGLTQSSGGPTQASDIATSALCDLRGLSTDSDDDLMLMAEDVPPLTNFPVLPLLLPPPQAGDQYEQCSSGSFSHISDASMLSQVRHLPSEVGLEEDGERSDMAFLQDLLSPGPGGSDEFSKEWQDAFGMFEPPSVPATSSIGPAARPPSNPPSPTGFLPSQLLDHSLSSTGWVTPPMFQAPPLQLPAGQNQAATRTPGPATAAASGGSKDMSAWFNLFADLDPLSNPDAIGRSADELLNA
ncbi:islet cell autoantigen 1-like isoform X1 [Nothobranchius furzeri]|uniref:Islet cell autoantigen 1-like n=1 Tax=Nothobranchius furzeri TaxID=105023 RepID=A0A1A8B8U0_NOTFU|nr:islet cell autoantigen 1-like isoform X1 [Nothobranchius furzeri]XP_015801960.1 islet cell autoantigen 1-like isoform X1 [Nothobranchius furzeri]KAF7230005.1 transcript variant X1 [Nothobranchius furzeri]KAF7230006.1 transcript variant X2 [Nothobranchius furzeri]